MLTKLKFLLLQDTKKIKKWNVQETKKNENQRKKFSDLIFPQMEYKRLKAFTHGVI